MDTKQYKFVGKDFDIEAAPTKIDGYNDEDMAMIENVKGQIEANLKKTEEISKEDVFKIALWRRLGLSSTGCCRQG